jgi:alpha-galactosidase
MVTIAFIGAGSVVFTRQLLADLFSYSDMPQLTISLHDIDSERLEVATGIAKQLSERTGVNAQIKASTDRRTAFEGIDFAINMIQVGGIDATRKDLEIPAKHGLLQTIGDTTGVGGVSRGLRTFPVLSGILKDLQEVAPNATLLNYTNPMAMNVWWASVVAPDVKVYGLCHSVYWTFHGLSELIGVPTEGSHHRAAGINHQAWLLEWSRDGEDLYPRLRETIEKDPELHRRVRVEMFRRLGYYPTETSEHSSEYLSWFLRSKDQIEKFRITPLDYIRISEKNVAEFRSEQAALAAGEQIEIESHGAAEYAPQVIHSIVTGTEREIHVNVPNRGLIDNLPQGAAIEVPARVDADGVHPIAMGALPPALAAINRPYVSVAELAVEAMKTGSPALVRQAMLVDPNASSTLTPEQIWALADELIAAHGDLIPEPLRAPVGFFAR